MEQKTGVTCYHDAMSIEAVLALVSVASFALGWLLRGPEPDTDDDFRVW